MRCRVHYWDTHRYKQTKDSTLIMAKSFILWSISDSNRLPQHCQCCALPDELIPQLLFALQIYNFFPILQIFHPLFCFFSPEKIPGRSVTSIMPGGGGAPRGCVSPRVSALLAEILVAVWAAAGVRHMKPLPVVLVDGLVHFELQLP